MKIIIYYGQKIGTSAVVTVSIMGNRKIRYDQEKTDLFRSKQIRRELLGGVYASLGNLVTTMAIEAAEAHNLIKFKSGSDAATIAAEFAVYFVLFDLYYYFLHRFFLHGKYGWWIHSLHHKSIVSSPATGFSFHIIEAVITGGFSPLLGSLLTFDKKTLMVIQIYGFLNTVFVHLGYEVVPMWWNKWWGTKWFMSSLFHEVHHQKVACHYGGFTTVWDRVFGTVHRDFEAKVDDLAARCTKGDV
ncbi:fatty acid hydroxylase superfamily-domain-containing protein [Obelidium mucronatum]|nr:fatty acid hydroxylase superfamily-domain-containing protein [Obelidium mucronatum]